MVKRIYKVTIIFIFIIISIASKPDIENDQNTKQYNTVPAMSINDEEETKVKKPPVDTSWNIYSLFKGDDYWEKELAKFDKDKKELENYLGKVTKSQKHLNCALDIKQKLDIRVNKLYAYVKLKKDTNKSSYKYLDMSENVEKVYREYNGICSRLELEILSLTDKEYDKMVSSKMEKEYGTYLESIRNSKEHYLSDESEDLLSKTSTIGTLPGHLYDLFRNMDKKNHMSSVQYSAGILSSDRDQRIKAFQNEFVAYNDNINVLAGILTGQVKKNLFYSDTREYKSAREMYLSSDKINTKIYDNLIDTVSNHTNSLHKYISLRKDLLGVDKVHYYDMFVPIVSPAENDIPYEKGRGVIYSAVSPLGKEYSDIVYKAFNERWIDVYPGEEKVGGAYCLSVYGNHPYVLVNYNNTLDSVSTLAHELGHAVYEHLSSKNQNYYNSNPSIFTHEVASTTNEALLYETLIKNCSNDEQKAYYITQYLDLIKDTLYTQTMYAEFEKKIHELVEDGENLNTLVLNDLWSELNKKYYGKDYEVDPLAMVGWSRIPHFYNSFYVYKYATGCSAGVSFAKEILQEGPENYLSFLKKGSSDYPIEVLKESGVNLESTKPINDTIAKFDSLLKELEEIIKK